MSFRIRSAEPDDAATLVQLIHHLAEYEQLAHAAAPDPDALAAHLAPGSAPRCEALLAESANPEKPHNPDPAAEALGFALFFPCYSTFRTNWSLWLEDLFVRPEHRRRGIGHALLRRVSQIAVARDCARVDWTVLDWNQPAIDFYHQLGARPLDDWTIMRLEGDALRSLGGAPTPFDSAPPRQ